MQGNELVMLSDLGNTHHEQDTDEQCETSFQEFSECPDKSDLHVWHGASEKSDLQSV